jgi:hypothetical protein
MKKLLLAIGILFTAALCHAQSTQSYNGWCQQGNQPVVLQGLNSTTTVQVSLGSCLVTVYVTGTQTLATIYADGNNTPLSNPFTANINGQFLFYAATSPNYDITTTGTVNCVANTGTCPGTGVQSFTLTYTNVAVGGGGGSSAPCTTTGLNVACQGALSIALTLSLGATPVVCGSAQDCIGFNQGTTLCNPTIGQNCLRSTQTGWNCSVNGTVEIPCVSNGLPVINVAVLGAVGNGVANDTVAIQAAVNACPQTGTNRGCNIFLPGGPSALGIYSTSSSIAVGTLRGVHFIGGGTAGRSGATVSIQTNGAYYAITAGSTTAGNAFGLQVDNLGFIDATGNGLGGIYIAGMTDGYIDNVVCNNYYVGICITMDGGIGVAQYFNLTNIYTWHTKGRLQTVHRTASNFIFGGEGNCQNSTSTDVIPGSIDIDIGWTRQVSWTGTITTSGTAFTVNSFTTGLGSFTQDYVNAPITINGTSYVIATVTSGSTGTLKTSAGTNSTVAGSITAQGGTGEYWIGTANQNCQIGIAAFNTGGTKFQGTKATEQTILYRPSGSFGTIIDGDTAFLTNNNTLYGQQATAANTGIWIKSSAQNTAISYATGDGTNGVDLVVDATAYNTTRIDPTYRASGLTTNIGTISRSGTTVTMTTVANNTTNSGQLCPVLGTYVIVYGVTGDTSFNGGPFALTPAPVCNDTTGVSTLTWTQAGAADSGTVNAGQSCIGGTNPTCVAALSTVTNTSTGLGELELTGGSWVTDQTCQEMRVPPEEGLPTTNLLGNVRYFCDGQFMDVLYGIAGYGVLHQSDGPVDAVFRKHECVLHAAARLQATVSCTTPASTSVYTNVCQSSDDKSFVLSSATNGSTICLTVPGVANGYPEGYSSTIIYTPGSQNNSLSVTLPGQTSIYGITCSGSSGTTLNGTTNSVIIPPGQGLKVIVHGFNWFADTGVTTYTPPTPGPSLIVTADVTGITPVLPANATTIFTFPPLVPLTNYTFHCSGTTVQATAGAGIGIAFGTSGTAATNMEAHATVATSATAVSSQSSGSVSGLSYTALYTGITGTATTQLPWTIDGSIEVDDTAPTNFLIGFFTINASDAVTVKRDSYCKLSQ